MVFTSVIILISTFFGNIIDPNHIGRLIITMMYLLGLRIFIVAMRVEVDAENVEKTFKSKFYGIQTARQVSTIDWKNKFDLNIQDLWE